MKKINLLKNMLWAVTGAIVLTWSACYPPYFESIEQPEEAELESSFPVDITVACDQDLSEAGRIVSNIGLQLPDSWDEMTTVLNTNYRLIFGIKLPLGWTVEDNFPFTGADTGIFSYSEPLSIEMNLTYPPGANYYWWMSENPDYLQTSSGAIYFSPVITTGDQPGTYYPEYSLSYWTGSSYFLSGYPSTPGPIYVGLEDTVYVTNLDNSGPGSLRDALSCVGINGVIRFDISLPAVIVLNEELVIERGVHIEGPATGGLWISGGYNGRIFHVQKPGFHLSNIILLHGDAGDGNGGGIYTRNVSGSLTNVKIGHCKANSGGGMYITGNNWELQDVEIEYSTAADNGGGIYNGGSLTLSGVTIRNNQAGNYGGGIYGTSSVVFDPANQCNIYSNSASLGFDLYGGNGSVISLNKFTVAHPNDYFTYPQEQFAGFSIQQCECPQIDQDVYVNPSGSDENTGLSPESPFKTISHALAWIRPNSANPNTIHLAPGTYSPETNGEPYPLYANSHVYLAGQDREATILGGTQTILRCLQDIDFRITGVKLSHTGSSGIYMEGSDVSLDDFILGDANYPQIYSISSTLSLTDGIIRQIEAYGTQIILARQGSNLILENMQIHANLQPVILKIEDSQASLNDCLIENNTATYSNDLISVDGNSHLEMSGTVIRNNNLYNAALAFSGTSTAWFDTDHRSSIHSNGIGKDIRAVNHTGDVIHVVLDTFTVLHPTGYYVFPLNKFTFDILNGMSPQYSQNIYVSPQGSDENTGLTPDDPLRTITRSCMIYYPEVNARDTIFLEAGTYSMESGEQIPIYVAEGLTLYGAGPELTGISGIISNNPIIKIDHSDYAHLKGLTLSGNTYSNGSGLQVSESNVFLDSCIVRANSRGISITGTSEISANGTEISTNGYGIYALDASIACNNLMVKNNNNAGGLYARNATVHVMNSSFLNNTATNGGGIYLYRSEALLENNLITGNSAEIGGGLYIDLLPDQSVTLLNNVIENNQASQWGGGLYISQGSVSLDGTRIRENVAQKGGGICFGNGSGQMPYFSGSTIAYNRAEEGGGIYFSADSDYNLGWDPESRCNILMNSALFSGQDLYSARAGALYPVVVDTFTVINPGNHFAYETGNYVFDILNGYAEAGDIDIYVSPLGNDNNSGFTPEDPVKTITSALFRTSLDTIPPQTIRLAEGVYSPSATGETFPVELMRAMEIIGQGAGITVLDGEFTSRLFSINYAAENYFRHLTMTGGNAGSAYNQAGGAIYCSAGGYLELEGIHLDTNRANQGGAIYASDATVRVKDATITRNYAQYGGFALLTKTELYLQDVVLSENEANGGGAIYFYGNNLLDMDHVSFLNNKAFSGGAIYLYGNFSSRARETILQGNSATSGGGIYASNAHGALQNIYFFGNHAKYGGAIRTVNSTLRLMNICMTGNISERHGSAINSMRSDIVASHLTISDNQSLYEESLLFFTGLSSSDLQPVSLTNCNIWGNAQEEIRLMAVEMTVDHCNIQNGEAAFSFHQNAVLNWEQGNMDTDPMFEGTGEHPYQLSAGSPCIDAGTPDTTGLNLPMWDLLGNYRLWDGDGDGDTIVDIGAYEFGSVGVKTPEFRVSGFGFRVVCYPNPFTVSTTIAFELEKETMVRIEVYNFQGAELGEITNQRFPAGKHRVEWNASGLPAGIYVIRVQTADAVVTKKVIKRH
ncbi:MAG: DUF1565 domain-containing protein [Bacteroidales bacterium]|nr:DUF1565 domain-containing protein [Bacteroidales bacterium]